jgi:hypothetical protein
MENAGLKVVPPTPNHPGNLKRTLVIETTDALIYSRRTGFTALKFSRQTFIVGPAVIENPHFGAPFELLSFISG